LARLELRRLVPASQITDAEFLQMFEQAAKAVIDRKEYLSELDMVGDADFGVNISRGFEEVIRKLSTQENPDIGTVLTTAGDIFAFEVGSTIGGLIGRALLEAGKRMQSKRSMDGQEFETMLCIMLSTIKEVGGAKLGEKTLVDALEPAVDAAGRAVESGRGIRETLQEASSAADEGAQKTAGMVSRVGRSSYLGERSKGSIDPGAAFISIFLRAMNQEEKS
jgi:dihydroxyacetone kinase-like protein